MKSLKIKISIKIIDSNSEKSEKKRLTIKDISKMKLAELENNINRIKQYIDKGEIDEYTINTFSTLCGKTVEILQCSFTPEDEEKQKKYSKMMEDIYKLEKSDEFKNDNEIINESNDYNLNNNKEKNENKFEDNLVNENKIDFENNDKNEIINDESINKNEKEEVQNLNEKRDN